MTADGRRPIYTDRPDIIERLLDALRAGNTIRNACNYAGIRPSTYFAWTAKARKETEDRQQGKEPNPRLDPLLDIVDRITKAQADAIVRNVAIIQKAAGDGTWQAAAWWLERTQHRDYARRTIVTGNDDGPPLQPVKQMITHERKQHPPPRKPDG